MQVMHMQQLALRGPPLRARLQPSYQKHFDIPQNYAELSLLIKTHLDREALDLHCFEASSLEDLVFIKEIMPSYEDFASDLSYRAGLECEQNDEYVGLAGFSFSLFLRIDDKDVQYRSDAIVPWGFTFEELSSTLVAGLLAASSELQDALYDATYCGHHQSDVIKSIEPVSIFWMENHSILPVVEERKTPFLRLVA